MYTRQGRWKHSFKHPVVEKEKEMFVREIKSENFELNIFELKLARVLKRKAVDLKKISF